jgi:hypothetical protein
VVGVSYRSAARDPVIAVDGSAGRPQPLGLAR